MSYIRCLSNPEGLYAWSNGQTVHLWHNVKKPLSSGSRPNEKFPSYEILVPEKIFHKVCFLWGEDFERPVSFRGARVEEVHVYTKTGKKVPDLPLVKFLKDRRAKAFLIRFSYKGEFFMMWDVTWEYVVRNAIRQRDWDKERSREARKKRARRLKRRRRG